MVPTPTPKQNALAPKKKLHRNRWDYEYDIYSHLQEKNRVLKSETEKSNYFHTLLLDFDVKDRKGDSELVQFMNGLYGNIVQSRLFHLDQNPNNIENTAEENGTNEDDDDYDDVMVDPQHMYFMDHVRPHGKSYVLDIPEDGVYIVYEPDQSSIPESTATITTDYSNHVSNEEVNVCLHPEMHVNVDDSNRVVKRRGRKPKGAKVSAATNGDVKGSDVASKPQKHGYNLTGRRRSKRLKLKAPPDSPGSEPLVIEDSDDEAEDLTRSMRGQIVEVEHCWQEYKYNEANASTVFRENLMEELKAPYCEEEYKRLLHDITVQKPIQHHRDLRGGIKIYEKPDLGKSFLGYHVDLAKKIETARDDHSSVLNLMRGFFYWLKNLSHEGAFPPWRDPSCLNVLPQQLEG